MGVQATPTKLIRLGKGLALYVPAHIRETLPWRPGDYIGVRQAGEKLIIERIPIERIAVLRTGEAQVNDSSLFGQ